MRKALIAATFGLLAAAVIATAAVAKSEESASAAQVEACTNVSLGFLGPLTGPAAFLGQEQISWLRFGVQKYNKENGTKFKVVPGDTQSRPPSRAPWRGNSSPTRRSSRSSAGRRARPWS